MIYINKNERGLILVFGNIMLAEQINMNQASSILLENAGGVFSVLSFPAYISMDVLLTLNGFKVDGSYLIKVFLDRDADKRLLVDGTFNIENEINVRRTTSTNVINLRKVPIMTEGIHELTVWIDNDIVAKAKFDVIKETIEQEHDSNTFDTK